ncbi:ABA4-like family protein [Paracraurococcus ruber]|uniref:DUF4281 domain-containing protein n=1 Tax=Paracraurococcus ruber TaxID=77675 RepID=A0ABS1CR59_9PROT|nr:ABA4-like family protein [Paracraurococcus ruber]MBK1656918.1 hypothetical protein [Paracraurococcus ruber]TDG33291.1 DUF4281 domain-containing protein [Paracraurococcus ruber]
MPFDEAFRAANLAAMLGWAALILLPRHPWVLLGIRWGVATTLSLLYAVLIAVFFRAEDGFSSLAEVQALFASPGVALAGWVHYLAFDLLVGLWIAHRADAIALHRMLQAPILAATFLVGPIGFLLFQAVLATRAGLAGVQARR